MTNASLSHALPIIIGLRTSPTMIGLALRQLSNTWFSLLCAIVTNGSVMHMQTNMMTSSQCSTKPCLAGLVEEGRIYFFYRPRVSVDHPTSVGDIQRFFMILAPSSRPKAAFRLLIIGKKRLPVADKHERFFGFVEATAGALLTLGFL